MADVVYNRVNWEDLPSTDTPINATNLNKMDLGVSQVVARANESMPYANILDDWTDIGAVTTPNTYVADATKIAELKEELTTINYGTCTTYSASATYVIGALVIYSNRLYRCTTAITVAKAWNATHWTAVSDTSNGMVYNTTDTAFYGIRGADSVAKKLGSGAIYLGTALTYDLKTNYAIYNLAPTDYMFLTADNFIVGMTSGVARLTCNGVPDESRTYSVGSSFSKSYNNTTGILTITRNNGQILVSGYGAGTRLYSDCGNFVVFVSF